MSKAVRLVTDRLILRQWSESDREPFAILNADPVVMEFFPSTLTRAESDAMADRVQMRLDENGWGLWAVEVVEKRLPSTIQDSSDRRMGENEYANRALPGVPFIGYVGLAEPRFQSHFTPCMEIGWRLDRHHWGCGYATEAALAVCRFAFEQLKLPEIVSFTSTINLRSRKVMERLGMTHDPADDFDHPNLPKDGRLCRHVLYRLNCRTNLTTSDLSE